ncbi:MAG: trimethylamine methyltransferase family protein [Candidatus Eisenbacteria bacterium]|nr:trimethylamine methyltransferase family protein [Candidatus Eisenbacteria bacterium]
MGARRVPFVEFLFEEDVARIQGEAKYLLSSIGVFVENADALKLLEEAGARLDRNLSRVYISEELVESSLAGCPRIIPVFDREGDSSIELTGNNTYFVPGSAALKIYDSESRTGRTPVMGDLVKLGRLTDYLPNIAFQSTAIVPGDVPEAMGDRIRLYVALLNCRKPVVTGTFVKESFAVMKDMLVAVRGSEEALREKPLAIFDCCPSPPLKWSDLTCQSLIDCARSGIPAELVSMPLSGATSPVTLAGSLVQHTAETLSGIVIHQLASPGSPVIYGGSPAFFDMRHGTTPMGAIETMMIDCAYAQIAKSLGLPTHAYMGLSDSGAVDYQGGLESGLGAVLAALAGVNVVSGVGMMEFENCQSLEKLYVDNDICGMAQRLRESVYVDEETLGRDVFREATLDSSFLNTKHTLKWFKKEGYFPSAAIDRSSEPKAPGTSALERAKEEVRRVLETHEPPQLPDAARASLDEIVDRDLASFGKKRWW